MPGHDAIKRVEIPVQIAYGAERHELGNSGSKVF
jgi:hypothetical protein